MVVRRVVGNRVVELSDTQFAELRGDYRAVLLDAGTGDAKHALHIARQRPDWLVIGLDANRDNMRRAAIRAAAKPAKGGLPNLVLVWAAVEQLPTALNDVSEVHVLMPWGSLLRGLLGGEDDDILRRLSRACRPGADFLVTFNLHAWRPPVREVGDTEEPTPGWALDELRPRYARAGWHIADARYLPGDAVDALATSWSRRLSSSREQFDVLALTGTVEPTASTTEPTGS